ncbi:Cytochrome c oxidase-assembly factor cox-23 [Colletotrichum higginsianum IMI 349063]|uniref:Cytochrome c oxidase-assembly factor cox-23 n=1 Tax=Colletotrichum higginsianum (strain IMI 349063) TaxID=759273 RepID=A0A1B7XX43_COLHI|nr:Cytochrome c oxidase-assembly factor cox-23 [Colletotrichum higginsianum IMI 349063]OBR04336.1 Cytochrome c oxidase-assembly factor cox-23 [Colletotrichum higginsianum IMI 349063]
MSTGNPQQPTTGVSEKVDESYAESKAKFENKAKSEYFDPCQELAQKSIKCLHRNGGDKTMCGDYFQAYRDCKKAWVRIHTPFHITDLEVLTLPKLDRRKEERKKNGAWW